MQRACAEADDIGIAERAHNDEAPHRQEGSGFWAGDASVDLPASHFVHVEAFLGVQRVDDPL
eukprot:5529453-Pyramimonas_sp.AAC.1